MRLAVPFLALLACSKGSKLDEARTADVDGLWDLAPDQTELAIVASPRAVDLGLRAIAEARAAIKLPDFGMVKPQLEAAIKAMFGGEEASPEDAGFAHDRAFALFQTRDGVLGVMPVADRDKFMAVRKGKRGSAEDTIDNQICRQLGRHYVCATDVKLFDRIGKGKLRGVTKDVGARGDVEVYAKDIAPFGDSKGNLLLTAELDRGEVSVHGLWSGTVDKPLADLIGVTAPKPDTKGASGFVTANIAPLLEAAPPVPVVSGVTLDQLAKSAAGPITSVIPAGGADLQFAVALTDPKLAQTVVDNCKDLGTFFKLADKQTPGACRIVMQGMSSVEADVWVEGKTLRIGAHKGPAPVGKSGAVTKVGQELAGGNWTLVAWGRGTTLNLAGVVPAQEDVQREIALSVHMMALINELAFAARVEKDGVRFRFVMRTAWSNPPEVAAKVIAISGKDILTGKGTETGKAIAAASAGSPFAADFDAGQGGLMLPLAMTSLAGGFVLGPAMMRLLGEGEPEESPTGGPPMSQADLVSLLLQAYASEAYPKWKAEHAGKNCPATLDEVATYLGSPDPDLPIKQDPWGHELVIKCDAKSFTISSLGPDGVADTADDIRASAP